MKQLDNCHRNVPLVTVCIVTYNHAPYIRECLDGVLMQETGFALELVIHDDASTDGTTAIVKEYVVKYPHLIKPILQAENQYSKGHRIFPKVFAAARGKYTAVCEGDDYWTDPLKLQKQVDFLVANPDYVSCFHWSHIYHEDTQQLVRSPYGPKEKKEYYTTDDLLMYSNFIATASVMFRNRSPLVLPPNYDAFEIGDFPLHIALSKEGKIGFIDKWMSVHRRTGKGAYTGNPMILNRKRLIRTYKLIGTSFGLSTNPCLHMGLSRAYMLLGDEYKEGARIFNALCCYVNSLKLTRDKSLRFQSLKRIMALFGLLRLYRSCRRFFTPNNTVNQKGSGSTIQ